MCPIHGDETCPSYNTHHLAWPRRSYKTALEKEFRRLHTVRICVEWHKLIHATTVAPKKPSVEAMRVAIAAKERERRGHD